MSTPLEDITAIAEPSENKEVVQMNIDEAVQTVRASAYSFFAIAILSIINSFLASKGVFFIIGLAITQIIDGVVLSFTGELNYFISLLAPLLFIIIGFFSAKRSRLAFIVGAIIYFFDGLLYLYFQEWLAAGFHVYILYKLYKGYNTISEYKELSSKMKV
jgi:hypothetical protein